MQRRRRWYAFRNNETHKAWNPTEHASSRVLPGKVILSTANSTDQMPAGHAKTRGEPFPRVRITGAPFERGIQYGTQAVERIERTLEIYRNACAAVGIGWSRVCEIAASFEPRIRAYSPSLHEEICGIAEGVGRPVEEITALNARTELLYWEERGSELERDDGCTGIVVLPGASANGHVLHAFNWDWRDECADCTIVLDVTPDIGPRLLTLVEAGMLARAGFNEAGIAVTGNNLETMEVRGQRGVPAPLIRRAILASDSYTAALRHVFDAQRSFSNNLMISSAGGEAIDLETTPEKVFWVYPGNDLLVHANHFTSLAAQAAIHDVGLTKGPDSLHRARRVQAALEPSIGTLTAEDLARALADRFDTPYAVCADPSPPGVGGRVSSTVATMIMDTTARSMRIAPTPYAGATFTTYDLTG